MDADLEALQEGSLDYILASSYNITNTTFEETNSVNFTGQDIIEYRLVQSVFCFVYSLIFVLGLFGNVLVCYVVVRNKSMHTVTNCFITNLALADILLCVLAVPFTPLYSFLGRWIFGRAMCHLVAYAQGTSVYISTLTLTSIAIDRFFVIIYPFQPRMKLYTCLIIIVCIWFFSLLVTLPYGIFMNHKLIQGNYYCEEAWSTEHFRQVFGALTATMQFVLPFFIVAFCYVRVSLKLNERARSKPGTTNTRKQEAERERKKRTNRMLIAMVTIFGISWLPLNLINLINDIFINTGAWKYYNFCFFLVHAIAMSSTCYNPFLYAWLNENFRKEFKQVLPFFKANRPMVDAGRTGFDGQFGAWKSERTYNVNETCQETLLPTSVVISGRVEDAPNPFAQGEPSRLSWQNRCHDTVEVVLVAYNAGENTVQIGERGYKKRNAKAGASSKMA